MLASYIKIKLTKGSVVDSMSYYLAEVMAYGTPYTGSRENMSISIGKYSAGGDKEDSGSKTLQIVLITVSGGIIVLSAAAAAAILIIAARKKRKA